MVSPQIHHLRLNTDYSQIRHLMLNTDFSQLSNLIEMSAGLDLGDHTVPLSKKIRERLKVCKFSDLLSNDTDDPSEYNKFECQECSICLCEYEKDDEVIVTQCEHIFHPECINPWFDKYVNCPICRGDMRDSFEEEIEEVDFGII